MASTLNDLGNIHIAEERFTEAEECYRRMEEIYRTSRGDSHYLVATALSNRANIYLRQGQPERAEPMRRDVIVRYTKVLSADHVDRPHTPGADTGTAKAMAGRVGGIASGL